MWISRQLAEPDYEPETQNGKSTLGYDGETEIVSTAVNRNVALYAPFGYSFSLPAGCDVLLTRRDGTQAGIGISMKNEGLKTGEIKITAQSGASIYLKSDGSVVINGLTITKNGVIE